MRTLYVRNVPDRVAETLEELARQEGLSLNALVVRELTTRAERAGNAALFATLPETDVDPQETVRIIREARGPL